MSIHVCCSYIELSRSNCTSRAIFRLGSDTLIANILVVPLIVGLLTVVLLKFQNLCETHDIVAIQEHWLLPFELDESSNIQVAFLSTGTSAVNVSQNGLVGRPYGVVLPSCRIKSLPVV